MRAKKECCWPIGGIDIDQRHHGHCSKWQDINSDNHHASLQSITDNGVQQCTLLHANGSESCLTKTRRRGMC